MSEEYVSNHIDFFLNVGRERVATRPCFKDEALTNAGQLGTTVVMADFSHIISSKKMVKLDYQTIRGVSSEAEDDCDRDRYACPFRVCK